MSSAEVNSTKINPVKDFNHSASKGLKKRKPATSPFSMRLTAEEREFLEIHAKDTPWAAYIRECVFGKAARKRRPQRRPSVDEKKIAAVISALGESRLASNLNQLAKSSNMGTLDVSNDTEQQLQEAAMAVLAMREALFTALGLKS